MPESRNSELATLLDLLRRDDNHYASVDWLPQMELWKKAGVYKAVAEKIALGKGDHHIDMASGSGILLRELRRKYRKSILWGVERSDLMVALAIDEIEGLKGKRFSPGSQPKLTKVQSHVNQGVEMTAEGTIRTIYVPDRKRLKQMKLFVPGGPVQLICDDLRGMTVVKDILDGRTVDSASFLFPGHGRRSVQEAPYDFMDVPELDSNEVNRRLFTVMAQVRRAAYRFASEYIKPNGRLFVVERTLFSHPDAIRSMIRKSMGVCERYWDLEEVDTLGQVISVNELVKFGALDEGEVSQSPAAFANLVVARRNQTLFDSSLIDAPEPDFEEKILGERGQEGKLQRSSANGWLREIAKFFGLERFLK